MPESANDVGAKEIIVTQMDTVAFLGAEYHITFNRVGSMPNDNDPGKKVAYWAYDKTEKLVQAMAEWNSPKRERTKVIRNFREEQRSLRQMKVKLERKD